MNIDKFKDTKLANDLEKEELVYRQLIKKNEAPSNVFCNLGIICGKTGRAEEAVSLFKKYIVLEPTSSIAYNNLALILTKQKKYNEAIENFLIALKFEQQSKTYFNLALAYEEMGKEKKATYNYKEALKIDSKNAEALCNLGNLYYVSGDLEEAKQCLEQSIKNKPTLDAALNNLGLVNMAYGDFKAAKKKFIDTLKINPLNSKAHYNLSNLISYNINSKQHSSQLLLNLKLSKSEYDKMYYCFALGKVYEDRKKYKESLQYFKKGNLIKRNSFSYTINDDQKLYSNIKRIFNKDSIFGLKDLGFNDHLPIFIVGMPRSGTSLIEQILSSHPDVFGAGEINDLESIILEFFSENNKIYSLKELSGLDHKVFKLAGQQYCLKLKKRSINTRFITNKLTLNFRWIGLIKLILPNVKIVHCKRHPYDTSLSIFQKFFPIYGNEYTFDLVEIAQYFKLYLDLMGYWKKILPNSFYEISYEDLINDQESQITKLLEYCNLPFNEKCYKFSNTSRIVKTSSSRQVRQKIYRSSMGKWKYYKKELFELINILKIPS